MTVSGKVAYTPPADKTLLLLLVDFGRSPEIRSDTVLLLKDGAQLTPVIADQPSPGALDNSWNPIEAATISGGFVRFTNEKRSPSFRLRFGYEVDASSAHDAFQLQITDLPRIQFKAK
jgi:hypothetical protein